MDEMPEQTAPAVRASDADRDRVAEVLRDAAGDGRLTLDELQERLDAVYAAKTYAELAPITGDLPGAPGPGGPAPVHDAEGRRFPADRIGASPTTHTAIAIMGGADRSGDWVVPESFTAFAMMGGIELDLRTARFAAREVTINACAIMGGIEITVPDDIEVVVNGVGVMGGFDHRASGPGLPGAPRLKVTGMALMGGVEVKRRRPKGTTGGDRRPVER